ncbi:MAG: hypothetical protein KDD64_13710 [Bdellovibrionales bacterium]|nr:hypothetical protein [Bdellovibrionales bacterium]
MTDYKFIYFQEHTRRGLKKLSAQISSWLEKETSISIVSTNLSLVGDYLVYTVVYRDLEQAVGEAQRVPSNSTRGSAPVLHGFTGDSVDEEEEPSAPEHPEKEISSATGPKGLSIHSLFGGPIKNG